VLEAGRAIPEEGLADPRRRIRPGPRGALVALGLALGVTACTGTDSTYRVVAEEENLTRQVADLRVLVRRAEKGALVPRDGVVVSVGEDLLQRLIQLALPREDVLENRFYVRLERAEVHLEDGHAAVRLEGRVEWLDDTFGFRGDVSAELTALGRVEVVGADTREGTLTARVVPWGFEIHRLRVGEERPRTRRLVGILGRALPEALATLSTRLTIPVAFEREVHMDAFDAGPVHVSAASVPVRVAVKDATAHGGRLWVVLAVDTGTWSRERK
jgi:hypothetical protein